MLPEAASRTSVNVRLLAGLRHAGYCKPNHTPAAIKDDVLQAGVARLAVRLARMKKASRGEAL